MSGIDLKLTQLARDIALSLGDEKTAQDVHVYWNSRMSSAAGRAHYKESKIDLNPRLKEISDDEVQRTLRHELAHLLTAQRYGLRVAPHGKEWKSMCALLGIAGEKATHRLDLPRRKIEPRFIYQCPECGFVLPRVKPLTRYSACHDCCKMKNGGVYHKRFRLVLVKERS